MDKQFVTEQQKSITTESNHVRGGIKGTMPIEGSQTQKECAVKCHL